MECSRLVAERRRARKILERNPTHNNLQNYLNKVNAAQSLIKSKKQESWKEFIENITYETPTKTVWDKIRKIKGHYQENNVPIVHKCLI